MGFRTCTGDRYSCCKLVIVYIRGGVDVEFGTDCPCNWLDSNLKD